MTALRLLLLSAVLLLLSSITFTQGMRYGSAPKSCCFDHVRQPVKLNLVKSYSYTSQQCSKDAVLFMMKKGRQICAKPSDQWVQNYITILDRKTTGDKQPLS